MNKKIIIAILVILVIIAVIGVFVLINNREENNNQVTQENPETSENENSQSDNNVQNNNGSNNSLVLYFSATGTTEEIAKQIAEITNSDITEIIPKEEYTSEDLNYNDDNSRANKEQNDKNARPEISNTINVENYDVIYLGYPIWWGTVPKIILTLLDNYDLSGKTVIPFCTSGGSGISQSINELKSYNSNINWKEGQRFNSSTSNSNISSWLNGLNLNENITTSREKNMKLYIKVNNRTLTATLVDNSSTRALIEKLEESDLTINMEDYASMEKVGNLGFNLPTNNQNINTQAGDLILYQGNSFVIYYDTNSWNFTRLGEIDNVNEKELREILGDGNINVILSLSNH